MLCSQPNRTAVSQIRPRSANDDEIPPRSTPCSGARSHVHCGASQILIAAPMRANSLSCRHSLQLAAVTRSANSGRYWGWRHTAIWKCDLPDPFPSGDDITARPRPSSLVYAAIPTQHFSLPLERIIPSIPVIKAYETGSLGVASSR